MSRTQYWYYSTFNIFVYILMTAIDDLTIVKDLVSLLLTLHYRRKGSVKIVI